MTTYQNKIKLSRKTTIQAVNDVATIMPSIKKKKKKVDRQKKARKCDTSSGDKSVSRNTLEIIQKNKLVVNDLK